MLDGRVCVLGREGSKDPKSVVLDTAAPIVNEEKFPGVKVDPKKHIDKFVFTSMKPNATSSTLDPHGQSGASVVNDWLTSP